ncbi:MAG: LuxR C-terminal-related transcriptional regulator [Candidatus Devosia phytovorans]|uniref:LuxR C-terminal-related transcriptional regulator n=1 Tax=Candidatus Devosia phytovorans TaxID=3121372 RepID=A0AAJ5VRV7_9HYPH|nr:LuxR C-terminal-related transcriptional regulator [Devosia sp.]WEK03656.1 MAG: LuxR C-terminal-related transcriptional regulator [Devosia sp.]
MAAFEDTSSFIAVLRGPTHVFELANAQYRKLMGDRDFIGRPVREAAPDVADQGFFEKLDHVLRTGESYVARDIPLVIARVKEQPREEFRINLLYSAIANPGGGNYGIFVEGSVISGPPGAMAEGPHESLLTPRELEVLHWSAQGKTADVTGAILGIATRTVHHYMSRIIDKLDADNHTHAVAEAFRRKIL